ncbi:hypothetical protein K488DRAFT_88186 [Vararia minispora EC-137]|uniref:Uncharacterized protein n=1 Tax=Vararia minispora EC-137 TaxID=1314806 RepID=A0ACB8QE57_9AGAM|nr:hypothetical protein K488DRAFT_88186 [Vararia minispora EC-137]
MYPLDGFQKNTLCALYHPSEPPSSITSPPPHPTTAAFLQSFASAAAKAATAKACGSLLAGHSSESDEFGDVAVWIGKGEYGAGHEQDVLRALGLELSVGQQINILSPQNISSFPSTIQPSSDSGAELEALKEHLGELEEKRFFAVNGSGEVVAFVLVGRIGGSDDWVGLLGVGIAADC